MANFDKTIDYILTATIVLTVLFFYGLIKVL